MKDSSPGADASKPSPKRRGKAARPAVILGAAIDKTNLQLGGKLAVDLGAYLLANPSQPTKQQLAERYLADVLHAWAEHPEATLAELLAALRSIDSGATGATFDRAIRGLVKAHRSQDRQRRKSAPATEPAPSPSEELTPPNNDIGGPEAGLAVSQRNNDSGRAEDIEQGTAVGPQSRLI